MIENSYKEYGQVCGHGEETRSICFQLECVENIRIEGEEGQEVYQVEDECSQEDRMLLLALSEKLSFHY